MNQNPTPEGRGNFFNAKVVNSEHKKRTTMQIINLKTLLNFFPEFLLCGVAMF